MTDCVSSMLSTNNNWRKSPLVSPLDMPGKFFGPSFGSKFFLITDVFTSKTSKKSSVCLTSFNLFVIILQLLTFRHSLPDNWTTGFFEVQSLFLTAPPTTPESFIGCLEDTKRESVFSFDSFLHLSSNSWLGTQTLFRSTKSSFGRRETVTNRSDYSCRFFYFICNGTSRRLCGSQGLLHLSLYGPPPIGTRKPTDSHFTLSLFIKRILLLSFSHILLGILSRHTHGSTTIKTF